MVLKLQTYLIAWGTSFAEAHPKFLSLLVSCILLPISFFSIPISILYVAFTKVKPVSPSLSKITLKTDLSTKFDLYSNLSISRLDSNGFPEQFSDPCDSLMLAGIYWSIFPDRVKIESARDASLEWFRRPLSYVACYPKYSASSISRDMFDGILYGISVNRRLDLAQDLWNYGKSNNWLMGQGTFFNVYFAPGIQENLAEVIYRLGGADHLIRRYMPSANTVNTGSNAHLDALAILMRSELLGYISKSQLSLITTYYNTNPKNALFSYIYHKYTDGVQNNTVQTLMNTQWFPADRLPSSADRSDCYLWRRDQTDLGWSPDTSDKPLVFSGTDFLFIGHLLLKDLV